MSLSNLKITLHTSPRGRWAKAPGMASFVLTSNNGQRAWVHLPDAFSERKKYPLMVVLHGAGKGTYWSLDGSVGEFAAVANHHDIIVLYPEANGGTWDFIRTGGRNDVQFIENAINAVRKSWPVNDQQIALKGISDGGSMALSLATYNPNVVQACLSVSAGFCRLADTKQTVRRSRPQLFLEHGEKDTLFPLDGVGRRNEKKLKLAGYPVEFRVARGQGHVPEDWRTSFVDEWLSLA